VVWNCLVHLPRRSPADLAHASHPRHFDGSLPFLQRIFALNLKNFQIVDLRAAWHLIQYSIRMVKMVKVQQAAPQREVR
jgi:hypothetical protein